MFERNKDRKKIKKILSNSILFRIIYVHILKCSSFNFDKTNFVIFYKKFVDQFHYSRLLNMIIINLDNNDNSGGMGPASALRPKYGDLDVFIGRKK